MAILVVAFLLLAAAMILLFVRRGIGRKLRFIAGTVTTTARELEDLWHAAVTAVGPSAFARRVEVKGVVECDSPLTSEVSKTQCVCYQTVIQREYEVDEWETNSQGRRQRVTRRRSEVVSKIDRRLPFWVRDTTGQVMVNPTDARLTTEDFTDRFEPAFAATAPGRSVTIGSLRIDLGGTGVLSGSRTLGYNIHEEGIRIGANIYVLGESNDRQGSLLISQAIEGNAPFIISTKSEEQLRRGLSRTLLYLLIGAAIAGVLGVVLLLAGIISLVA